MVLHAIAKPFSLVLFMLEVLLNGYVSAGEVKGREGEDITIHFTFQNISNTQIKYVSLHRNNKKIHDCRLEPINCSKDHCVLNETSKGFLEVFFCIRHLSSSKHTGIYRVVLYPIKVGLPIESNKQSLIISNNNTTEPPPAPNIRENRNSSPTTPLSPLIILAVLVVLIIVLFAGLLGWFCWTHTSKLDQDQHEDPTVKPEVSGEATNHVAVSGVEYGVLDFHSRPRGGEEADPSESSEVRPTDSVEYAAIIFPRRQR